MQMTSDKDIETQYDWPNYIRGMPANDNIYLGIHQYTSAIVWFEHVICNMYDPLAKMECTPKILTFSRVPRIPCGRLEDRWSVAIRTPIGTVAAVSQATTKSCKDHGSMVIYGDVRGQSWVPKSGKLYYKTPRTSDPLLLSIFATIEPRTSHIRFRQIPKLVLTFDVVSGNLTVCYWTWPVIYNIAIYCSLQSFYIL